MERELGQQGYILLGRREKYNKGDGQYYYSAVTLNYR